MNTVLVWVLYVYVGYSGHQVGHGGPMVIDNIASRAECERIQKLFVERKYYKGSLCFEVEKKK